MGGGQQIEQLLVAGTQHVQTLGAVERFAGKRALGVAVKAPAGGRRRLAH